MESIIHLCAFFAGRKDLGSAIMSSDLRSLALDIEGEGRTSNPNFYDGPVSTHLLSFQIS